MYFYARNIYLYLTLILNLKFNFNLTISNNKKIQKFIHSDPFMCICGLLVYCNHLTGTVKGDHPHFQNEVRLYPIYVPYYKAQSITETGTETTLKISQSLFKANSRGSGSVCKQLKEVSRSLWLPLLIIVQHMANYPVMWFVLIRYNWQYLQGSTKEEPKTQISTVWRKLKQNASFSTACNRHTMSRSTSYYHHVNSTGTTQPCRHADYGNEWKTGIVLKLKFV